ncbi:MAG: DUF11 domain-containing protein, partial [Anaerolineae bacterium]|nr:DUF11 domain-containing protein [Anaerolineae bacterium]
WGEPSYNVGNVLALNNGNLLPVVLSMNCESGRFDGSTDPCFAEAWQRNPNGGAVGVVAATRNSYSGYNDWMAEGIIDAIWPDFLTYNDPGFALPEYRVAAALNYGKIAMTVLWGDPWGEQQLEFELFHWFGDPTMEIHTAPPMGYEVPWLIETPVSGTVAAGDSIEVAITFDAAAVAETGQYTAELLVPSDDPFAALIRIPVTMTVVLDGPVLEITKMASDDPVEAGALLTYTLTVENHGNEDATGVTITDTVPADTEFVSAANGGALVGDAVTWTGLAAPAGDSITVMFTVGVDSPLPNGSVIANDDYAVTCTEGAGDVGPSVEVTVSSAPILAIAKTADPGISVEAGDLLTYTLVVENTGNADATGVTISDAVPADTTFVSADAGGVLVGGDVRWTGKTAPVGDALTVRFTVRVDSPLPNGTLVVNDDYGVTCAQGASTTGAPVEVTVTSSPQLTISKTASHDPVQAGALLTYTITAVNTGNANAGGSVITDVIPVGTTFVAASDGGKLQGDRVEWTDKVVPSGGDLELTFTVRVDSPLPNGTLITNAAYGVTCACGCHAVGAPVEATVESAPVLSIIKTANATYVNPGELLTYTLTVSNTGNANASGVTISDTLPANVVFISADAGGAAADGVVTWDGLAILAGEHISVQLVVEIAMPLPDGAEIVNASYGATCAEGSFAVGSPVIAIVESAPLLAIAVQAWPEMVAAGDFITYTITVSNQGNADATGVDVYDRLPTYTTFISADGGGVLDGDTVKWLGYVVPAGDSLVMHLMVQVDPGMGTGGIVSNDDFGATCAEGGAVQGEAPVDVTVEQTEWFVYLALLLMD